MNNNVIKCMICLLAWIGSFYVFGYELIDPYLDQDLRRDITGSIRAFFSGCFALICFAVTSYLYGRASEVERYIKYSVGFLGVFFLFNMVMGFGGIYMFNKYQWNFVYTYINLPLILSLIAGIGACYVTWKNRK